MTRAHQITDFSAARRTLLALLATALGIVPLKAMLADNVWLIEAWLTMVVVSAPATLLRLRRGPSALDIWPGIVLLIPWLTAIFVHDHAWLGFIPNADTWHDISRLMDDLHDTTRDEVAPIHSTVAVRLVVCALAGLLVALIDLIAVVGRHGALAGVPLLAIYTASGAVPRSPVAWFWFAIAAGGFLLLLGLDASDELGRWGRRIPRPGTSPGRPALAFSAQRIGVVAVVVAVLLPLVVPDQSKNLIADAFHGGGGSSLGGFGAGSGTAISPFAALKGQLTRDKAIPVMSVHVSGNGSTVPFYVRSNVLEDVTESGWQVGDHGPVIPLDATGFGTDPPAPQTSTVQYSAQITITGLTGNPALFALPRGVSGLVGDAKWSPRDEIVVGTDVQRGQVIHEHVAQPAPTAAELSSAPNNYPPDMQRWLRLPSEPKSVSSQVASLIRGRTSPYAKARAISDFFANPQNGFTYSLSTQGGDSGSELADFLSNRQGYCQQYAAAMGIMLRMAGVPARVVLGYMHPAADKNGNFTITTFEAHAWVEAYFPGFGWVPFDPTPPAGLSGGKKSDLPWAPHVFASKTDTAPAPNKTRTATQNSSAAAPSTSSQAVPALPSSASGSSAPAWFGLAVLIVLLLALLPGGLRAARRRRRLLAASRHGDPDPLWAELIDTAVDLGYVWSPARSPRQVSTWLGRDAGKAAGSLAALAAAVEQRRYAPDSVRTDTSSREADRLARGLTEVSGQLRARRSVRTRVLARLWPASLGWGRKLGGLFAVAKHHR